MVNLLLRSGFLVLLTAAWAGLLVPTVTKAPVSPIYETPVPVTITAISALSAPIAPRLVATEEPIAPAVVSEATVQSTVVSRVVVAPAVTAAPAPACFGCLPPEVLAALHAYARPGDIAQWTTILSCETTNFDNVKRGAAGEVSIAQILPSTLASVGLGLADVQTYTGAVHAAVLVSEEAGRQRRGDRFWPWTTRGGC